MKKITLLLFAFISAIVLKAQEEIQLASKDGIKVSYQLILEEQGKKKDKYILIVNAVNTTDNDLFYGVQLTQNDEGKWQFNESNGFTIIKVRNATGLFGAGKAIVAEKTDFITTDNKLLFVIKKGTIYSDETTFKVAKGDKPLITNTFLKILKSFNSFDIKVNSKILNGNYISSCGNIKINISLENSAEKGDYLLQTTNGKQFIWIRTSEYTFVRENNSEYSLTFNKKDNSFTYTTTDGITCIWTKE